MPSAIARNSGFSLLQLYSRTISDESVYLKPISSSVVSADTSFSLSASALRGTTSENTLTNTTRSTDVTGFQVALVNKPVS